MQKHVPDVSSLCSGIKRNATRRWAESLRGGASCSQVSDAACPPCCRASTTPGARTVKSNALHAPLARHATTSAGAAGTSFGSGSSAGTFAAHAKLVNESRAVAKQLVCERAADIGAENVPPPAAQV